MTCENFETLMADALGNELSPEDRPAFEAHLASCESCRREYESLSGTIATLQNLPGPQKVSVIREGSKLVIDESGDARLRRHRHDRGRGAWILRYAASVLIAFVGGYAFHAAQEGIGQGPVLTNVPDKLQDRPVQQPTGDLQGALVRAHARKPLRPDLAKALIALGGLGH